MPAPQSSPVVNEAAAYAAELGAVPADEITTWLSEVASESPYWDERTLLLCGEASAPEDLLIVFSDGADAVVVRFDGAEWVLDHHVPTWEEIEAGPFSVG